MELYLANQSSHYSPREKDWLCTELEDREKTLQETRMRTLRCTEAERARQLRTDELSRQEKESQSIVNQLTLPPET